MTTLYIRIHSFIFSDKKHDQSGTMYFNIINNVSGFKRQCLFKAEEASKLKKTFNMKLDPTVKDPSFRIELYKKHLFTDELIGHIEIHSDEVEQGTKSYNMLELVKEDEKSSPVIMRCLLQRSQGHAYKCMSTPPRLPQYDAVARKMEMQHKKAERINLEANMRM